jgi:thioredoxin-related protein
MRYIFIFFALMLSLTLQNCRVVRHTSAQTGKSVSVQKDSTVNSTADKRLGKYKNNIFVFEADWCTPCEFMNENLLKYDTIKSYIDTNYALIKIDIETFEGHRIKQKYPIKILPAMVIETPDSIVLEQINGTITPAKFLEILKKHNQ